MKSNPIEHLRFLGPDGWTAEDLTELLKNLYVLYNRTIILNAERQSSPAALLRKLDGSKSRIDDQDRLVIQSLTIRSPIKLDLKGLGEPVKQIRGLIRDLQGGNQIELEARKEALLHRKVMNRVEEREKQLGLLVKALDAADKVGATPEERKKIVEAIFHPAQELASVMNRKRLQLEETKLPEE